MIDRLIYPKGIPGPANLSKIDMGYHHFFFLSFFCVVFKKNRRLMFLLLLLLILLIHFIYLFIYFCCTSYIHPYSTTQLTLLGYICFGLQPIGKPTIFVLPKKDKNELLFIILFYFFL